MKIVLGITGASGSIFGIKLLEKLSAHKDVQVHLIMSKWAIETIKVETEYEISRVQSLADEYYDNQDMCAKLASGSFKTDATIILPCSIKTLSAIANGYNDTLIARAADVAIKESRTLIICPRETPLNGIHLENMLRLSNLGVRIMPPMPAFYYRPLTIDDLVEHFIVKIYDMLGLETNNKYRWTGIITPNNE